MKQTIIELGRQVKNKEIGWQEAVEQFNARHNQKLC